MKKILVIEDDVQIRTGIEELLNNSGYNVFSATGGNEGIKIAKEIIPDLIISDIMMPGVDGYQVLESLNEEDKTSSIPFIFLTAKADMSDLRKGMELGADDYIVKPFELKTLLNAVEVRLKKKEKYLKVNKENQAKQSLQKSKFNESDRIFIDNSGKIEFIKVGDIACITSLGNYCKLTTITGKNEVIRKTLSKWENQLPESVFVRIHRSYIINLNFVEKISKWSSGTFQVYLKGFSEPIILSQRFAAKIKSKLKF